MGKIIEACLPISNKFVVHRRSMNGVSSVPPDILKLSMPNAITAKSNSVNFLLGILCKIRVQL